MAQLYPYNNFEVLSVARFTAPDVRTFNAAVDATHNIYRHRRGASSFSTGTSAKCCLACILVFGTLLTNTTLLRQSGPTPLNLMTQLPSEVED